MGYQEYPYGVCLPEECFFVYRTTSDYRTLLGPLGEWDAFRKDGELYIWPGGLVEKTIRCIAREIGGENEISIIRKDLGVVLRKTPSPVTGTTSVRVRLVSPEENRDKELWVRCRVEKKGNPIEVYQEIDRIALNYYTFARVVETVNYIPPEIVCNTNTPVFFVDGNPVGIAAILIGKQQSGLQVRVYPQGLEISISRLVDSITTGDDPDVFALTTHCPGLRVYNPAGRRFLDGQSNGVLIPVRIPESAVLYVSNEYIIASEIEVYFADYAHKFLSCVQELTGRPFTSQSYLNSYRTAVNQIASLATQITISDDLSVS